MARHYILMGDVIESGEYEPRPLRRDLLGLVESCNQDLASDIRSPYTVTLGDEFQGVAGSLAAAVRAILYMEDRALRDGLLFDIRYVVLYGSIDTPINPERAHTMAGAGLTRARELLNDKGRGEPRFRFELPQKDLERRMNRLFLALDGIRARWDREEGDLILDMLENRNNSEVAEKHDKDRTSIWRRRGNLLIEEYRAVRETILEMVERG